MTLVDVTQPDSPDGSSERPPVVKAEVLLVSLPLLEPFVTGFGVTATRNTVLVHLVDAAGNEGWGEAPALDHPFYLPETTETAFSIIRDFALPLALDGASLHPEQVAERLLRIRGNPFARAGVEAAFWCLAAAVEGVALRDLLGGTATAIPVGESIGIKASIDETLDEVTCRLEQGFRRIKLKIRPGWDVDVVAAVRQLVGPDVMLQVDANAAYSLSDTEQLAGLDEFDLACIEQPLGWDELLDHAELQRLIATSVCLDESLRSVDDVRHALDLDACRNVNLKPARVGGISASRQIAALCRSRGISLWCGGMMESGIGRAANLAVAALPGFTDPADMSPAAVLFESDLVDPTYDVAPDGTVAVPTSAGLGFPVDLDRVRRRTLRQATVT